MSRRQYLIRRAVITVFLIWLVLTFLFFFVKALPGSFVDKFILAGMSAKQIAAIEAKWGLDQPLHVQYWRFLLNYLQLDAGTSLSNGQPVLDFVKMKMFNSFILVAPAITLAYIIGSVVGGLMGHLRGSRFERYGLLPILTLSSFPEFVTGILLIILFSGWLDLLPPSGMFSTMHLITQNPNAPWWRPYLTADFAAHYILPFSVIVARVLTGPSLTMRTNVIEVKGQDFFYYHRITGLPNHLRLYQLFKHASLPVITLYPISLTQSLGGLVILETVFNWPGIGFTLVQAVFDRNFPVVIFLLFLIGSLVIIANFVIDIVYGYIDPRIEVGDTG